MFVSIIDVSIYCYLIKYKAINLIIYDNDVLSVEKLYKEKYENILIYDISCKNSTGAKPLRIRFDGVNGFLKIHDKIWYLLLFDCSYCDKVCDRIKYLINEKRDITR